MIIQLPPQKGEDNERMRIGGVTFLPTKYVFIVNDLFINLAIKKPQNLVINNGYFKI